MCCRVPAVPATAKIQHFCPICSGPGRLLQRGACSCSCFVQLLGLMRSSAGMGQVYARRSSTYSFPAFQLIQLLVIGNLLSRIQRLCMQGARDTRDICADQCHSSVTRGRAVCSDQCHRSVTRDRAFCSDQCHRSVTRDRAFCSDQCHRSVTRDRAFCSALTHTGYSLTKANTADHLHHVSLLKLPNMDI